MRPLDLDALERKLPAMEAMLLHDQPSRQKLALAFRIALIKEALSSRPEAKKWGSNDQP